MMKINSTRVDPALAASLTLWITSLTSHLKEWAGVAGLVLLLCGGCCLSIFLIMRMRRRAIRESVAIHQAMLALQRGDSPQMWLNMLWQS